MMTEHELKTIAPYFEDIRAGRKTFEVRRNDRNFKVGDVLVLQHYDPCFTGEVIRRRVTYVLRGTSRLASDYFGIEEGFVVLTLAKDDVE